MRPVLAPIMNLEQRLELTLNREEATNLQHWRKRSRGKCSMLTKRFRNGATPISTAEYRHNNKQYGDWLNGYMEREAWFLNGTLGPDDFCIHYSIGPHALGMEYLSKIVTCGLCIRNIRAVDWLPDAIRAGRHKMCRLFGLDPQMAILDSIVVLAEIKRFSKSDEINPDLVKITQIARVVEHDTDAAELLRGVGKPLANPNNVVVVAGAFNGEINDREPTVTSRHYSTDFHLEHLSAGAGREVRVVRNSTHRDFANLITAITCVAA